MIRLFGAPQRCIVASRESRQEHGTLNVDVVDKGVIPPCIPTRFHRNPRDQWHAGVYDKSGTVCGSSLLERFWGNVSVPFLPTDMKIDGIEHVAGEAVYGGLLFNNFGHFLLESTNRLWWPLLEGFKGHIVFQHTDMPGGVAEYASRFFDLIGISNKMLIADKPLSFDRIIVPQPSLIIQKTIFEEFRIPFLTAGESAEKFCSSLGQLTVMTGGAPGLYLSRTRYPFRRSYGEERIEDIFRKKGFSIISMETLPLEHQILIMRRHKNIVGVMGSAFHTMLFSSESKNAIYLCRDFNINFNYFMIDEIMQNNSMYIYNDCASGELDTRMYSDDTTLNLSKLFSLLLESRTLQHTDIVP
jgi:capsular polysaccharide biosynthesis protein